MTIKKKKEGVFLGIHKKNWETKVISTTNYTIPICRLTLAPYFNSKINIIPVSTKKMASN